MHAKSPRISPASMSNRVASASGLTTDATAARIKSITRLSLRHDGMVHRPRKAPWANLLDPGERLVDPCSGVMPAAAGAASVAPRAGVVRIQHAHRGCDHLITGSLEQSAVIRCVSPSAPRKVGSSLERDSLEGGRPR